MLELTIYEAIDILNSLNNMERQTYDIKDYAPNTLYDILDNNIENSEIGDVILITYRDRYAGRNLDIKCIKMSENKWEDIGNLYNREKGCLRGDYYTDNKMYKSLRYIIDNDDCLKLEFLSK